MTEASVGSVGAASIAKPSPFTLELMVPIGLTAVLVKFYMVTYEQFYARGAEMNYMVDVYTECWWSSPLLFSLAYLLMVFGGKAVMQNYEPWSIAPYMFWYNVYQCIMNLVCVVAMLYEVYSNPHYTFLWGNFPEQGKGGLEIGFWVWVHYHNKYVELLDTAFMIVRKKNEQASFLHCYHHILLIWSWFLVVKTSAGGDSYFGGMVNSFIHVIMYAYYTMPIIGIKVPTILKKSITKCQMAQFCICLAHAAYVAYKGNCPLILPATQAFVMINMLVLFAQFSKKAYGSKKKVDQTPVKAAIKPVVSEDMLNCPARLQ